ncbi:hypothetical protein ACF1A5_07775 [Streptomyces sp. NPDC014864]|uniref:hypothetical protein n=1 Tax=Streptomyces sp. NPDC014864 TaxID=3364924 RepID=UPI0036FF9B46
MSHQPTPEMPGRMRERLDELRRDYERGRRQLQNLLREEAATREGLLRVSGAIQVLEEMLPRDTPAADRAARTGSAADAVPAADTVPGTDAVPSGARPEAPAMSVP